MDIPVVPSQADNAQQVDSLVVSTHRGDQLDALAMSSPRLIMFVPAAFTPTCTQEVCDLNDLAAQASQLGVQVMVASCDAPATLSKWLQELGVSGSVIGLSDHWPHGALASALDAFDDTFGVARRHTWAFRSDGTRMRVAAVGAGERREFAEHLRGIRWASES